MMTRPVDGQIVLEGILVVGTEPQCGKTVVTAGLAGALQERGFVIYGIKPLSFTDDKKDNDPHFLDTALRPLAQPGTITLPNPRTMTSVLWQQVLHQCRKLGVPCLIDSIGGAATTLGWTRGDRQDVSHWVAEWAVPVIVVTPKQPRFLETLIPTLTWLQRQNCPWVGWVAVETLPPSSVFATAAEEEAWSQEAFWVSQTFQIPFLGVLPYSPSINVHAARPGNVIRLASDHLDLLPVTQVLNLELPCQPSSMNMSNPSERYQAELYPSLPFSE